jgi:hypothetical protein
MAKITFHKTEVFTADEFEFGTNKKRYHFKDGETKIISDSEAKYTLEYQAVKHYLDSGTLVIEDVGVRPTSDELDLDPEAAIPEEYVETVEVTAMRIYRVFSEINEKLDKLLKSTPESTTSTKKAPPKE